MTIRLMHKNTLLTIVWILLSMRLENLENERADGKRAGNVLVFGFKN